MVYWVNFDKEAFPNAKSLFIGVDQPEIDLPVYKNLEDVNPWAK